MLCVCGAVCAAVRGPWHGISMYLWPYGPPVRTPSSPDSVSLSDELVYPCHLQIQFVLMFSRQVSSLHYYSCCSLTDIVSASVPCATTTIVACSLCLREFSVRFSFTEQSSLVWPIVYESRLPLASWPPRVMSY